MLGITFSSVEELRGWHAEQALTFDLLSDTDRKVALAYGAASEATQAKAARVSVLIDRAGVVRKSYADVDAAAHPGEALRDVLELGL